MNNTFFLLACHKEKHSEQQIASILNDQVLRDGGRTLGEATELNAQRCDKSQFKVGSLDQLMELMDTFAKLDTSIDGSCKRYEKIYKEMNKELELPDTQMSIEIEDPSRQGPPRKIAIEKYV
jgi:hypothetical protein